MDTGEEAAPARRSYDASGRRAAAGQRRVQVVEAATRLFTEHGWGGTTIAAVAREAGVSPELIGKTLGGKQELLMAAMRAASFGERGPLPQAFAAMRLEEEPDLDVRLDRIVGFVCDSLVPMARFVPVMVQGAEQDDRMRVVLEVAREGHLVATRELVRHITTGTLHPDAIDEVYLLTRAETYLTLVPGRGWPVERYAAWLRRALVRAVAPVE